MSEKQNITPYNNKGQRHGYHEVYWLDMLGYKCNYINGKRHSYLEFGSDKKRFILR